VTQKILYMITPIENISPFDVTIAADAGFDQVLPFTNVHKKNVVGLVQDAVFARPPKRFNDTGIFIGGRDVHLATDMFKTAKKAMVGPFEVAVFADPNGAYTTSASIVALIEQTLQNNHGSGLQGRTVAVFGTGPVGLCSAVLAAKEGATVRLCQLTADDDQHIADRFSERYEVKIQWASALTHKEKVDVLQGVDVVICAAKAGVRILEHKVLDTADQLLVAADTNAVPPSGIDSIGLQDKNKPIEFAGGTFAGIGPLAIGNLKYKVQYGLFVKMQESESAAFIDFQEAYEYALEVLKE
jgi:methylene-tetrahydromethanopterin dehydrogenase